MSIFDIFKGKQFKLEVEALKMAYDELQRAGNRERKTPQIESFNEENLLSAYGRFQLIAQVRELTRAYPTIGSWLKQYKMNVVGKGVSIQIGSKDETFNSDVETWFNEDFFKTLDGTGNRSLRVLLELWLTSQMRDGDVLVFFDSKGIIESGKTFTFEADQLAKINDADFDKYKENIKAQLNPFNDSTERAKRNSWNDMAGEISQGSGVILNQWGKSIGYVISNKRAQTSACLQYLPNGDLNTDKNNASLLMADDCYLLMEATRVNQYRGVSEFVSIINSQQDIHEIIKSFEMKMKVQSYLAIVYKTKSGARKGAGRISSQSTGGDDVGSTGKPSLTNGTASTTPLYNLEKLSRGAIEYVDENDSVEAFQMAGDSAEINTMLETMLERDGYALGLTPLYSTGKTTKSYSASRAEANLAQVSFSAKQMLLQDFLNWLARKAIALEFDGAEGFKINWGGWVKLPQIDPTKDNKAKQMALSTGLTSYQEVLGHEWEQTFEQISKEKSKAGDLDINLDGFNEVEEDINEDM